MTRSEYSGLAFVTPALILVLLVSVAPAIYMIIMSFHQTSYNELKEFIGLKSYIRLLKDPTILKSFFVSLKYVFGSLLFSIPLGLAVAVALNRPFIGKRIFSVLVTIPWVISQTVTGLNWLWLLNSQFGPINYLIQILGFSQIDFLANPRTVMPTIITINTWMTYPFATILLLAALQAIPSELYEAIQIDGGGKLVSFKEITLPFILGTITVTAIMLTVFYFNMVTLINVITGGGPVRLTETLSLRIYKEAFLHYRIGYAATVGIFVTFLNILFGIGYIKVFYKEDL